ncbi:hypothetical protein [Streptomyces griseorubiginosus]|uniref:hypothetical protein n=1 Tax=Streptomyces griseorubiginosus TaxID=67304 RepID=UPI0036E21BB5
MPRAALDATPTNYQARLLLAALDDCQRRVPSDAKTRTLHIMDLRQWVRPVLRDRSGPSIPSNVRHWMLTHHGVNAANRARTAQLAEKYPVATPAVYVPEEGEEHRDIVVVMSEPAADGTVEAHSVKHSGPVRVPLAGLRELPPLRPEPEGDLTDCWVITDAEGAELARVEAKDDPGARTAAMRHPKVRAAARRDKGFAVRRLHTSELSVPIGELRGLPRISTAPAERVTPSATPARFCTDTPSARRTITVTTGMTRKSIPTRLRESSAPGAMVTSEAAGGALRWRLPNGEELTPGDAAKRFLDD